MRRRNEARIEREVERSNYLLPEAAGDRRRREMTGEEDELRLSSSPIRRFIRSRSVAAATGRDE